MDISKCWKKARHTLEMKNEHSRKQRNSLMKIMNDKKHIWPLRFVTTRLNLAMN